MKKIHLNNDITKEEKNDLFLAENIEDFLNEVLIDKEKTQIS